MHIDKVVIGRLADVSLFIPPNQPVLTLKDLQLQGWQRESMLVEPSLWYVQASYKHDTILPSKALCCGCCDYIFQRRKQRLREEK